jgi:hypothetical protein
MPIIENIDLYNKIKNEANKIYNKPSAYKSGWIVKTYKNQGGTYQEDNKPKDLKRWFSEEWADIGNKDYPVYRPFKRINKDTPLTAYEIDPIQAKKQIDLKQIIRGNKNLPAFKSIGKGLKELILLPDIPKTNAIWLYSNPIAVRRNANKYLGNDVDVYISNKPKKKYMVQDTDGKWVHFGQLDLNAGKYEDFTKHNDKERRANYLKRTANIKGNWKDNKYSPNNLSRNLLWT